VNGPRRPFPAVVRGRPLDFSLVLLSLKAEGRQVDLVLVGIAPVVPEHVVAVALDGHVESAAAAFGARCLGQPHLVRFRGSSERAAGHQEVLGIFARTLCKCVSQDVPAINQGPDIHVCTPLRGIRNDNAKGEATLLAVTTARSSFEATLAVMKPHLTSKNALPAGGRRLGAPGRTRTCGQALGRRLVGRVSVCC
jgi:hypothetical protein